MFKDNWWLGVGVGNQAFRLAYGLYMKSGFDALGTYCVPLEVAVETGVIGFLIFGALIVCMIARAHVLFWQEGELRSQANRWLMAGAAAALAGLMVQGFVDTVFYRPQVHFIFWFMAAIIFAGVKPKTKNEKSA